MHGANMANSKSTKKKNKEAKWKKKYCSFEIHHLNPINEIIRERNLITHRSRTGDKMKKKIQNKSGLNRRQTTTTAAATAPATTTKTHKILFIFSLYSNGKWKEKKNEIEGKKSVMNRCSTAPCIENQRPKENRWKKWCFANPISKWRRRLIFKIFDIWWLTLCKWCVVCCTVIRTQTHLFPCVFFFFSFPFRSYRCHLCHLPSAHLRLQANFYFIFFLKWL